MVVSGIRACPALTAPLAVTLIAKGSPASRDVAVVPLFKPGQRVLLARALYRQPRILVLDEATSHLASGTEQAVNSAIRQIALTRIIVAHRSETIAMAQRVVMLDQGRIRRDMTAEQERKTGDPADGARVSSNFAGSIR